MIHYYLKRKLVRSPVKALCSGDWIALHPETRLKLADVDCPACLQILIGIEEKRLAILRSNLLRATGAISDQTN